MKYAALCLALLAAPSCFALDAEEIRELAEKPHSRENLQRELAIYGDAREFETSAKTGKPGEALRDLESMNTFVHVVEGMYVVTQSEPLDSGERVVSVVSFDSQDGVYRKSTLLPNGTITQSIGTAAPKFRSISWLTFNQTDNGLVQELATEVHTGEEVTFRSVTTIDGKVTNRMEGVAKKTK